MNKTRIGTNVYMYPMPTVLVGAMVDGRPNFMAVAWVTRVNAQPAMMAMGIGLKHHTLAGLRASGTFSINVPSVAQLVETDYCGIVTGRKHDKSGVFRTFTGVLPTAPLIEQCPLCIECRVTQLIDLPTNALVVGEVVETWCEKEALTDGQPDINKLRPFTLTMPDNRYWALGEQVGEAWKDGLKRKRAPR